ncbi:coat protein [Cactus virus X]|uniref:Coat protein n=1 Tax=Cactus virus X TaxID=112227 RepID=Q91ND3_9VIRU|nr:coat protein [Cactus virus X]AAK69583.1 coat protein [Cactus virus X]
MSTTGVQSSQSSGPRSTPQSGPFQTLSSSQLAALSLGVTSSLLPSPAELVSISQALTTLGASATNLTPLSLEIVNYCFDNGSSPETVFKGDSTVLQMPSPKSPCHHPITTLRQFCRYFAKIIWNYRVSKNLPPAAWEAWAYKPEQKFAAFDFFDGVLNEAALNPIDGLVRVPNEAERLANQTNRNVHLFESNAQKNRALTTSALVTKGLQGSESPRIQFLPGPE